MKTKVNDWADDLADKLLEIMLNRVIAILESPGSVGFESTREVVAANLRVVREQGVGEGIDRCRAAIVD